MNTDGSLVAYRGGSGGVIWHHESKSVIIYFHAMEGKAEFYHEITAVRIGLELAKRFNLMHLILATDSTNAKEILQKYILPPWKIGKQIRDVEDLMASIQTHKIIDVYEIKNGEGAKTQYLI